MELSNYVLWAGREAEDGQVGREGGGGRAGREVEDGQVGREGGGGRAGENSQYVTSRTFPGFVSTGHEPTHQPSLGGSPHTHTHITGSQSTTDRAKTISYTKQYRIHLTVDKKSM